MSKRDWALALGLAGMVALASWLILPAGGYDWRTFFGPAGRQWHPAPWAPPARLPYAPWAALAMAPLATLPDRAAGALINAASVVIIVAVLRRYGGSAWLAVPLVVNPFAIHLFWLSQLDVLILAGLLLPRSLVPIVLVIKPQVAFGALVAHLAQAAAGGWRKVVEYGVPTAIVGLVSLAIWPGWPWAIVAMGRAHVPTGWNITPWPWGLPLGLFLLVRAWRRADDTAGVLATPFLVPYLNAPTLVAPLVMLAARWPQWFWAVWLIAWAMTITLGFPALVPAATVPAYAVGVGLVVAATALLVADFTRRRQRRKAASLPV